jgi:thiol-disulfide isomerase/thioredoxin
MKKTKIIFCLTLCVVIFSSFNFIQKSKSTATTVYVFLSETCPICQSYTLTLKKLYKKYKDNNIKFIGVFPNYYADKDSVNLFKEKYQIPFELIMDTKAIITKRLRASITPEVFVENEMNQIVYSGRIDDSFFSLGKRRNIITSNDLDKVLNLIASHQSFKPYKTKAVGCIINTHN